MQACLFEYHFQLTLAFTRVWILNVVGFFTNPSFEKHDENVAAVLLIRFDHGSESTWSVITSCGSRDLKMKDVDESRVSNP